MIKENAKKIRRRDITGQTFGQLTALYDTGRSDKFRNAIWHMKCICGRETDVSLNYLSSGRKRSCGCIKRGRIKRIVNDRIRTEVEQTL